MERHGIEGCPGYMSTITAASQTANHPPRFWIPMGCTQSGERGYKFDPAAVGDAVGQCLDVFGLFDHPHLIPEPLYSGTTNKSAAL